MRNFTLLPISLTSLPLDFSNVFCYTLLKLVDRIITATQPLLCVLSVTRDKV